MNTQLVDTLAQIIKALSLSWVKLIDLVRQ